MGAATDLGQLQKEKQDLEQQLKGSYFEIPTYFWLLSVEVAFLYSLYRVFPA